MPKYDPDEAVLLYLCGMSITDVAAEYDVPRSTMRSFLKTRVELRQDPIQREQRTTCFKGHEYVNPLMKKDGARYCRTCKNARDRRWKRERNARRNAQGLPGI